jgi:hypothetical protein
LSFVVEPVVRSTTSSVAGANHRPALRTAPLDSHGACPTGVRVRICARRPQRPPVDATLFPFFPPTNGCTAELHSAVGTRRYGVRFAEARASIQFRGTRPGTGKPVPALRVVRTAGRPAGGRVTRLRLARNGICRGHGPSPAACSGRVSAARQVHRRDRAIAIPIGARAAAAAIRCRRPRRDRRDSRRCRCSGRLGGLT